MVRRHLKKRLLGQFRAFLPRLRWIGFKRTGFFLRLLRRAKVENQLLRTWTSHKMAASQIAGVLLLTAFVTTASSEEPLANLPSSHVVSPTFPPYRNGSGPLVSSGATVIDPALPHFQAQGKLTGSLNIVGSDILADLMTMASEALVSVHHLDIHIIGRGSSTAIPAFLDGLSDLAPMTRRLKPQELDAISERFPKRKLVQFPIAIDALYVVVHKDNPLNHLTMEQLAGIYATPRSPNDSLSQVTDWSQVGWPAGGRIAPYTRNSASSSYGLFKMLALAKRDYRRDTIMHVGGGPLYGVEHGGPNAIGYITHKSPRLKTLSIVPRGGIEPVHPMNIADYPLRRFLYVVAMTTKDGTLPPRVSEFLRFFYSKQGQYLVFKNGYEPLSQVAARACLDLVKTLQ